MNKREIESRKASASPAKVPTAIIAAIRNGPLSGTPPPPFSPEWTRTRRPSINSVESGVKFVKFVKFVRAKEKSAEKCQRREEKQQ